MILAAYITSLLLGVLFAYYPCKHLEEGSIKIETRFTKTSREV